VTTPALREAARAIVLDPDDRVVLLRYDENGAFWATPGGSLEPGETHLHAVIRELREELGIQHVDLGPHLATRIKDHPVAGRNVRQAEQYYLARVRPENVQPLSAANSDNIQEWRWWTLAELRPLPAGPYLHPGTVARVARHHARTERPAIVEVAHSPALLPGDRNRPASYIRTSYRAGPTFRRHHAAPRNSFQDLLSKSPNKSRKAIAGG
jgi:8-oxo-dGTP pyrophosphatase MutT (NUDIX family)